MNMSMKLNARSGLRLVALCGIVLGTGLVTFHARADQWNKRTTVTFSQPTQIIDTYLEPGTYVLKLLDSQSNRHVVQIFNADQTHIINTIIAIPNERLQPTGDSRFAFWETPPGSVKALRAWFYPGDNFGQEFPYPKNLRQIAYAHPAPPPAPVEEAAPPPPPPPPAEQPAPVTQEQAPPPPVTQPEIAQNEPPPPPQPPPPVEAPPPPQQLPKTATPYPVFGFAGLISLGLFAIVRAARSA
jgi:outer membrane biosynthesis protein TonB